MITFIEKLKQNKFLSEFLTYKSLLQFAKYLIVGFTAFAVEYISFRLIYYYTGKVHLNLSNSISMGIGFIISFILNRNWSFKSNDSFSKQFIMMALLFFINLSLSNIIISFLTGSVSIPASISKLIVMVLIVLWNFAIYKKLIYKR